MNNGQITKKRFWWEREKLRYYKDGLHIGNFNVIDLADQAGTPLFIYDLERMRNNLERMHTELKSSSFNYRLFFAMKANHYLPVLTFLKTTGLCGLDVCSSQELLMARQTGFTEEEISFTGTSVSNEELEILKHHPKVSINCDSLSMIARLGVYCPGREIGLRINPGIGLGHNEKFHYSGSNTTKFGIYKEQFKDALSLADKMKLEITGLHMHCSGGYLTSQLFLLEQAFENLKWFMEHFPNTKHINIGGGLGIPLVPEDEPLDLKQWVTILRNVFESFEGDIWIEPGGYIVKDSGILVLQVNTIEKRRDKYYIGVNGGYDIHPDHVLYDLPSHVIPCQAYNSKHRLQRVTVAGHLNDGNDIWNKDVFLPAGLKEGDYLAFLNAGAYAGSARSSDFCGRGKFSEYVIF